MLNPILLSHQVTFNLDYRGLTADSVGARHYVGPYGRKVFSRLHRSNLQLIRMGPTRSTTVNFVKGRLTFNKPRTYPGLIITQLTLPGLRDCLQT